MVPVKEELLDDEPAADEPPGLVSPDEDDEPKHSDEHARMLAFTKEKVAQGSED